MTLQDLMNEKEKFQDYIISMLQRHEGLRLEMYLDSVGVPTLGYGHNLKRPISLHVANEILHDDIMVACMELDAHKSYWRTLPFYIRVVIVNMQFNLGWPRFSKFVRFWAAIERNDYKDSAVEMKDSLWYGQVKTRAVELVAMMEEEAKACHN